MEKTREQIEQAEELAGNVSDQIERLATLFHFKPGYFNDISPRQVL